MLSSSPLRSKSLNSFAPPSAHTMNRADVFYERSTLMLLPQYDAYLSNRLQLEDLNPLMDY